MKWFQPIPSEDWFINLDQVVDFYIHDIGQYETLTRNCKNSIAEVIFCMSDGQQLTYGLSREKLSDLEFIIKYDNKRHTLTSLNKIARQLMESPPLFKRR